MLSTLSPCAKLRQFASPAALAVALATPIGFFTAGEARADVPSVAVDIAPLHSLVAQVMGDLGDPALVLPPTASPHGYSLRPSEARALAEADLVFWIGPVLTPWLDDGIDSLSGLAQVVSVMELPETRLREIREGVAFDSHDHDHGHGDEHGDHDDHDHDEDHAEMDDHDHDHDHDEDHAEKDDHDHDHDHDEDHAEKDDHDHDHDHDEDHAEKDDHDHDHDHDEEHAEKDGHDHDHDHDEEHAKDDDHAHEDDHGHDDDHAEADGSHAGHANDHGDHVDDPHVWLDPQNAQAWLGVIATTLGEIDPENAEAYRANAEAAQGEIDSLTAELQASLEPLSDLRFGVFHDAYAYFEARFGITAVTSISIGDGQDPGPRRLAEVRDRIAEMDVTCMAAEPQFDPDLIASVADTSEIVTTVLDPLGAELTPGPDLYGDLLRGLAAGLAACRG